MFKSIVYQVNGTSGSYSDVSEKTIVILQEEEMARRLVAILTSVASLYNEAKKSFEYEKFDYNEHYLKYNNMYKVLNPSEELARNLKSKDKEVKKQAKKEWAQITEDWGKSEEYALMIKQRTLFQAMVDDHNKKEREAFINHVTSLKCKDDNVRQALLSELEKTKERIYADLEDYYEYSEVTILSEIDENISDFELLKMVEGEVNP